MLRKLFPWPLTLQRLLKALWTVPYDENGDADAADATEAKKTE